MEQYIGVAVPNRMAIVRHIDATDPQWATFRQAMGIFAQAYSQVAVAQVSSLLLLAK